MPTFDHGTADWWREYLLDKFEEDVAYRIGMQTVYESEHRFEQAKGSRYAEVYGRLIKQARTPWWQLVVDLVAERLNVIGFSVDGQPADADLWTAFRANRVDAVQEVVHTEALAQGTSYVSVWWNGDQSKATPKIVHESALQVTHETDPEEPHRAIAAIKVWYDIKTGFVRANVYLPGRIEKFRSVNTHDPKQFADWKAWRSGARWTTLDAESVVTHSLPFIPIVPFVTRPNYLGKGRSDLYDLVPIFDRIETLVCNLLLAADLTAFRQKWATGIDIPKDPDTGQAVEPFKAAIDRLWISPDEKSKFGSFEATDLRPYIQAISDAIGQLSSNARIPAHYFIQSELANPPSEGSYEASEASLVRKVGARQRTMGEGWETVAALVSTIQSTPLDVATIETSWGDTRTRSEVAVLEAATKMFALGVPTEAIWSYIGATPQQVATWKVMAVKDTMRRLLTAPLPGATGIERPSAGGRPQGEATPTPAASGA